MQDGAVIDTDKAQASWQEATYWDGSNHISVATRSQWNHETLLKSRKARYYVESFSQWQGSRAHAEWVSKAEAARWLLVNGHELPDDLISIGEEVTE